MENASCGFPMSDDCASLSGIIIAKQALNLTYQRFKTVPQMIILALRSEFCEQTS